MDAVRRCFSVQVGSAWGHALRFNQPLLDQRAHDPNALFDMIDGDAMQLEMIKDAALGAQGEAGAIADQCSLQFDALANSVHGAVERQALPKVNERRLLPLHLVANRP